MSLVENLKAHPLAGTAAQIRHWRAELRRKREVFFKALEKDTGKAPHDTYLLEWISVDSALDFLEREAEGVMAPQRLRSAFGPVLGRRILMQRRLPLGRVLVIGTWNYPLALHLTQVLFALAAGNQVIFKGSPKTPEFSRVLQEELPKIFGPERFECWEPSNEESLAAVRRGRFQLVVFTGGSQGAKAYALACAEALIPFISEASGSEVALALPHQDLASLLDHLFWATFHYCGQTCVAPRFWFFPKAELEAAWTIAKNEIHHSEAIETLSPLQDSVREEHRRWIDWLGQTPSSETCASSVNPDFTVTKVPRLEDLSPDSPSTFGPAAALVGYESLEACVEWIRKSPWSLMSTVIGQPSPGEMSVLENLDASIVSFQEAILAVGDGAIPFGGRGASGYGVCHGREGLMQMSRSQTWQEVSSWPGFSKLQVRPSWRGLARLQKMALLLKDFEEGPLETARAWKARLFGENEG